MQYGKLKPCPYCGLTPVNAQKPYSSRDSWKVECAWCGRRMQGYSTEEEAIEAWNRRAN